MNYRLKSRNEKVTFLLRAGKDLVKSQMEIVKAQHIIDNGKMMDSNIAGYPINIDNKWYFEGEIFDRTISDKTEDKE